MSALIDDLMEIAKRDAGIITIDRSEVNVEQMVARAVNPLVGRKNVTIDVKVPGDLIGFCDEIQTVQLVRNLVDNAAKYTPENGLVEISAWNSEGSLVISVKDTGIGIPHGEVERIFERFYRVDKARSRRLGGTGLGLAIVKDIVDAHGGEITVETQLGKGSAFVVRLPAEGRVRSV